MPYLMPNPAHPDALSERLGYRARHGRPTESLHFLARHGGMDYIMGHNAGALWDQMTADKD